jgi:osmotically-inducible protein OsmY
MTKLWMIPLLLVVGIGYAGCERSKEPGTKSESVGAKTESKMSDSDLEKAVRAKIESDPQLKQANINVDANADKKEVTLSGTVPSQDMRAKAIELAKAAEPGVTINDKIDVKPAA